MPQSIYFARQPILDVHGDTYAYELLYRTSLKNHYTPIKDDMSATAQVLVNALNLMNIDNILGKNLAFVNISESLLMDEMIFSIPASQFILEILETVTVTDEIIERVKELKQHGYRFALDDVDCSKEYVINFQRLFEFIDIIKLDITIIDRSNIANFLALFKRFDIKVLAEKVETQEEYNEFKALGCDLFQGYFFAKPDIIENKRLDPAHIIILKLIKELSHDINIDTICHTFEQNVAITIQLLRFINSASFSFRTQIKSIRQAITLLGPNQLKSWLLLISYANLGHNPTTDNPILHLAQTRANLMESLCNKIYTNTNKKMCEKSSFIGLLSLIESIFNVPLEEILRELNLDSEIIDVLVYKKGALGKIYKIVHAIETFDTDTIEEYLQLLPIDKEEFSQAINEAYIKTEQFSAALE